MIHSRTRHQEILIFSFCSLKDAQQDLRFRQSQRQWHRKYYVRLFSYIRKTKKNLSFIPPCQHQTRMKENLDPTAFQNKIKNIFSGRHFIKQTYIADSAGSGWSFHLRWVKWRERTSFVRTDLPSICDAGWLHFTEKGNGRSCDWRFKSNLVLRQDPKTIGWAWHNSFLCSLQYI